MTESEARTAKISEVWAHFKDIAHHYERKHHFAGQTRLDLEIEFATLRAVLLERCEKEWDIMIVGDCASMPPRTEMSAYVADEYISVLSFMAWELKQRNSESNG